MRWSHPSTPIYQICDKPLDVPDDVNLWGFDFETKRLVTADDPAELRMFDAADAFFAFDENAKHAPTTKGLKLNAPDAAPKCRNDRLKH